MAVLEHLEPKRVFHYFEEITKIPHGSGNTKQISDYVAGFAKEQGLRYIQEENNNIIVYKDASTGYENAPVVILQGHMDMVCEKLPASSHNFEQDPLNLQIDGDSILAEGTTLGGDNGIAIAYGLAILESKEWKHPALEVLFTVDEEIGLLGAAAVDASHLHGKYLINLDSEKEGYLCAGCAGGVKSVSEIPVKYMQETGIRYEVKVSGLLGGHSGEEIDKKRGNAIKVMARFLFELGAIIPYHLAALESGSKDNAIPRFSDAVLYVEEDACKELEAYAADFTKAMKQEYTGSDEGIQITAVKGNKETAEVLQPVSQEKLLFMLNQCPNGIQKMCGYREGLPETSCNIGIVKLDSKMLTCTVSVRSSVHSAKVYLAQKIQYLVEFLGGEVLEEGEYPAWEYLQESPLRTLMMNVYQDMYGKEPEITVIHAGLECGLLYEKLPGLDCISVGPNMEDIHTSEERLNISSTKRVFEYLVEVLKRIC